MRKFASVFSMLMLCSIMALAQLRPVTGKVTDENGQPMSKATIQVKGTKRTVVADDAGSFTIDAKTGDVLVVSAVNSPSKEFAVSSASTINISLVRQNTALSEVTVTTALGIQRQAKSLGYSTATVKNAELTQAKPVNLQNGLTGKVSGLSIQTTNSSVFGNTRILLRGIRSLTGNNQPMLIVDGVPMPLGYINSISSNDVADVSVLKSAAGTAIYGPEGVNGAIIITMRKGTKLRPNITLSHTYQVEAVTFLPKMQYRFGSGSSVDRNGFPEYTPYENQSYGPEFDGSMVQIGRDDPNGNKLMIPYSPLKDEKKKFWNHGTTNQTDVSFSTGGFYISAQNVDIKGITPKDENHRKTARFSSTNEYKKFRATFNVNFTNSNYNIANGDVYQLLVNTPQFIPITRFKDWRNDYWSNPNGYFNDYYANPYWEIDNYRAYGRSTDLFGNADFTLAPTNWLTMTYRIGGTSTSSTANSTGDAFAYSAYAKALKSIAASDINASVAQTASTSTVLNSEFFMTAKRQIKKFKFDATLGYSFRENRSSGTSVSSGNLGIPEVHNVIVRKGEPSVSQSEAKSRSQRFYFRGGVNYNEWLFLEGTASSDLDSKLVDPWNKNLSDAISNARFFYPSGSVSAVLTEAIPSLKSHTLSYLKLRGAIVKTANVSALPVYGLENPYAQATNFPYSNLISFVPSNTLRFPSYKPEKVVSRELGMEASFFKNRVGLEVSAYTEKNKEQLITPSFSGATGFSNALVNGAYFVNKGIMFDLKINPLVSIKGVNINFKGNYTHKTNRVYSLVGGVPELGLGNFNYLIVGYSANTFKLTDYVRDPQGHVVIDAASGMPKQDPNQKIFGKTMPTDEIGLSLNADWKNFTLGVVVDFRGGHQINSYATGYYYDFTGISERSAATGRQPFVWPNSVIEISPGKYVSNTNVYTDGGYDFFQNDININTTANYLSSGAFWKLREVALGYTFPARWFLDKPIRGATLTLTGRNLAMWLPKTNRWTDPEFSTTTGNAQGVNSIDNTPPTRMYGVNLTLNF